MVCKNAKLRAWCRKKKDLATRQTLETLAQPATGGAGMTEAPL